MTAHEIELKFEHESGDQRKVVFAPNPERGCWSRSEFRRDEADQPWQTVGVELVETVAVSCTPVELTESVRGP
ncbi:hypothetical protein GCM10009000_029140 [Halobacterium noricense]